MVHQIIATLFMFSGPALSKLESATNFPQIEAFYINRNRRIRPLKTLINQS